MTIVGSSLPRWRVTGLTVGAVVVGVFVLAALVAPLTPLPDPLSYSGPPYAPPSGTHPLGTDDVGHDLAAQLVHGARQSLSVGLLAGVAAAALAALVGITAGFVGGRVDAVAMRIVDVGMALPHLPLMMLLAVQLGPHRYVVVGVIAGLGWFVPARVIRSAVLGIAGRDHIRVARFYGGSVGYLIRRHVLPAVAPVLATSLVLGVGRAIGLEAMLAFLGLADPLTVSWGTMMRHALSDPGIWFGTRWVVTVLLPGLCIGTVVLGLTLIASGLETRWDPRLEDVHA